MTCYSVLALTPTPRDWIPDYPPVANALVIKHGSRYIARTTSHEQSEGRDQFAGLRIILEGPSKDAAIGFLNDRENTRHREARSNRSTSFHFLIEGGDELA